MLGCPPDKGNPPSQPENNYFLKPAHPSIFRKWPPHPTTQKKVCGRPGTRGRRLALARRRRGLLLLNGMNGIIIKIIKKCGGIPQIR